MVIIMDMSTGKHIEDDREFGAFSDEVLLSNWMPRPELGLGLQEVLPSKREPNHPVDADAFLKAVYSSQE